MKKGLLILITLGFLSCNQERKQWDLLKQSPRFSTLFKFGYQNRETPYLDSAILVMNDSLSVEKDFWLTYHDDTIDLVRPNLLWTYKIAKSSVIFYNCISNELTYIDSSYTTQNSIDSMINFFIKKINYGGFCVYSDTLKTRGDWLTLFSTIDKVVSAYQNARENYALSSLGIEYRNLLKSQKAEVIIKIRMSIEIYFKHPFPPPPPENFPRPTYIIPKVIE